MLKLGSWHTDPDTKEEFMITSDRLFAGSFRLYPDTLWHKSSKDIVKFWLKMNKGFHDNISNRCWIQTSLIRHDKEYKETYDRLDKLAGDVETALDKKLVEKRAKILKKGNPTHFSILVSYGALEPTRKEFSDLEYEEYRRRLARHFDVQKKITRWLDFAEINYRKMTNNEWAEALNDIMSPDDAIIKRAFQKINLNKEILEEYPNIKSLTPREEILRNCKPPEEDSFRHGGVHTRIYSVRELPDKLPVNSLGSLIEVEGPWMLSHTTIVTNQLIMKGAFKTSRFAQALWKTPEERQLVHDYSDDTTLRETEEIAKEIADNKQLRIVFTSTQFAISDKNYVSCDNRGETAITKLAGVGLLFSNEDFFHHEQMFKMLPGFGVYADRLVCTSSDAALQMLPLNMIHAEKDELATFYVRSKYHTMEPVNISRPDLATRNTTIVGGSGSGKTLLANLLIKLGIAVSRNRGPVLTLDHSGEKSGYKNMCLLSGGNFIQILTGGYNLNPFPSENEIMIGHNEMNQPLVSYCMQLLEIAYGLKSDDRETVLMQPLLRYAIEEMYKRRGAPSLPKLSDTVFSMKQEDKPGHDIVIFKKFMESFLASSVAKLLESEKKPIPIDSPYTVLDIEGIKQYNVRDRNLLVYILNSYIHRFMTSIEGHKYIIYDELARYLTFDKIRETFETLYATARAKHATIISVTQQFGDFTKSAVKDVVINNSLNNFFLRPRSADRDLIISEFKMTDTEAELYDAIRTIKGISSGIFFRQTDKNDNNTYKLIDLLLDTFEYQGVTSDPDDRAYIESLMKKRHLSRIDAIEFIARQKEKALAA